jgi:F-type H+-transporting ATPase subunit delta
MSSSTVVAKRYARALFEVAQEKQMTSQVEEDLKNIVGTVNENNNLAKILQHPGIAADAKLNVLKEIFGGKVSDIVLNTLKLLIERRREGVINALLYDYVAIANEALGQAKATVYTAFPVSEEEIAKIAEQFGKLSGKTIRVEHVIDQKLLGGLQVRIGDRLYEGSLAGKLDRLKKSLEQTQAM